MTEQPTPLPDDIGDFWLFDSTTPARFNYSDGKFIGADVLPDDHGSEYVAYRETAFRRTLCRSQTGGRCTASEPF